MRASLFFSAMTRYKAVEAGSAGSPESDHAMGAEEAAESGGLPGAEARDCTRGVRKGMYKNTAGKVGNI